MGVQLHSRGSNPLTSAGDLLIGGGGTVTGFTRALVNPANPSRTTYLNAAGATVAAVHAIADDNDATQEQPGTGGTFGWSAVLDLTDAARIGRYRFLQLAAAGQKATQYDLQSADALAGPWTTRHSHAGAVTNDPDDRTFDLAVAATARFWRIIIRAGAANGSWSMAEFQLWAVTTVGAGNQTRLAAPVDKRHLTYDVANSTPTWEAPGATIADLGATVGEANNAASSTLVATKAEHDATRTAFNTLLARLEAAGILAS